MGTAELEEGLPYQVSTWLGQELRSCPGRLHRFLQTRYQYDTIPAQDINVTRPVAHSGGAILLSKLCPNLYVDSLHHIQLSHLKDIGIKGIVFDIDNTVTMWGSKEITPITLKWLEDAKAYGFRVCLLSNNRKARIDDISRMLDIPSAKGFKPFSSAFRSALSLLGTSPQETAIIGDQIFTDILGGNRAGLYTILVQPMSTNEFITTRFLRRLEKTVLRRLACRGLLNSEDCDIRNPTK